MSKNHETTSYANFQAAVIEALPRDINLDVAIGWTHNGESLARVLKRVLVPADKPFDNDIYLTTVNYDLSVEDAVKLGRYGWVDDRINSSNFPIKRKGTAYIIIEFIGFNKVISTKNALRRLDRMDMRPIDLHELLAFGEKHPNVQLKSPIVALGSVRQNRNGDRSFPRLDDNGSWRFMALHNAGHDWPRFIHFAAVRRDAN